MLFSTGLWAAIVLNLLLLFLWIKILEAVAALNAALGKSGIIVRSVFLIQSAASVDVDAVFVVAYVTV